MLYITSMNMKYVQQKNLTKFFTSLHFILIVLKLANPLLKYLTTTRYK